MLFPTFNQTVHSVEIDALERCITRVKADIQEKKDRIAEKTKVTLLRQQLDKLQIELNGL